VAFACKRFLLSLPLPRHALFCARPNFRAAKKQKMPQTCGKPYGNACYAGYFSNQAKLLKNLFFKSDVVMRFPAKKNAGCPKAPRDFPPRKDGILHPPLGCLATPLPLPQSPYGQTDGRTLTSQPQFVGSIDYQISLAMGLRWHAPL